jgi:pimeloyl-ACP methyl ester carboxylesterase
MTRTVELWDPPITAKVFESGDGEPLLFLHSGGGITASDPLVDALARRRKVIAPRHPGFVDPD